MWRVSHPQQWSWLKKYGQLCLPRAARPKNTKDSEPSLMATKSLKFAETMAVQLPWGKNWMKTVRLTKQILARQTWLDCQMDRVMNTQVVNQRRWEEMSYDFLPPTSSAGLWCTAEEDHMSLPDQITIWLVGDGCFIVKTNRCAQTYITPSSWHL